MAAPMDWLKARAKCYQADLNATAHLPESPTAVVIAQPRPGDFPAADFEQLQAAVGDAPVFVLAGPWCEGELRSGTPLRQVVRIEWRRWRTGFDAELGPLLDPPSSLRETSVRRDK
jgi:hypothetical protein